MNPAKSLSAYGELARLRPIMILGGIIHGWSDEAQRALRIRLTEEHWTCAEVDPRQFADCARAARRLGVVAVLVGPKIFVEDAASACAMRALLICGLPAIGDDAVLAGVGTHGLAFVESILSRRRRAIDHTT